MSLDVANEIRNQLGRMTLALLGAKDLVGDERALQFTIQGCPKVNKIRIALDPWDLYTVTFYKYNRRTLECPVVGEFESIPAETMHDLIKSVTGLEVRL